jgi:hypothetical protein
MRKLLPLLFVLLLPPAACGGNDNDVVGPEKLGSLSFSYSGDISGTYSVSGEPKFDNDRYPQNPFGAAILGNNGFLRITAMRPTQRPTVDGFMFRMGGITGPTTIPVCPQLIGPSCPDVVFSVKSNRPGELYNDPYQFTSGSVTISEITAERVRGNFQGTAVFRSLTDQATTRTITITNGQFDVPIRNELTWL